MPAIASRRGKARERHWLESSSKCLTVDWFRGWHSILQVQTTAVATQHPILAEPGAAYAASVTLAPPVVGRRNYTSRAQQHTVQIYASVVSGGRGGGLGVA